MRIISKQHDYYDTVQIYGIDKSITYIRKEKELTDNDIVSYFKDIFNKIYCRLYTIDDITVQSKQLIIFCGKVYPFLEVYVPDDKNKWNWQTICHYIFDLEELVKLYNDKKSDLFKRKSYLSDAKEFFSYSGKEFKNSIDFHFSLESPIINVNSNINVNDNTNISTNIILRKFGFQRVVDPYTAYQELSMFISGVMGGQCPPMLQISDKVRLEKHGFDKWSFRKMPD